MKELVFLLFALASFFPTGAEASDIGTRTLLSAEERLADRRPVVIAHRGCWRHPAENSLAGIAACAALGVDFVEIDLRETKDGVIVLLHDATLDRMTNLTGALKDHSYAELKTARLREGLGGAEAALTNQHIPTFEEVLAATKGRVLLFLDIKEPLHDRAFAIIQAHKAEDRVLFSMNKNFGPEIWNAKFLGKAAVMPKLSQYVAGKCSDDADPTEGIALYQKLAPNIYETVFCSDGFLARYAKAAARSVPRKVGLWVNTLDPGMAGGRDEADALKDPDAVWGTLLDRGVTAIQTDHPAELIAYLRVRGER